MDFKPMHSTGAWYRAHGSFEHPQVGTVGWTAAIHESDLDSSRGRWRPSVEFTSTFVATLSVRTPDYGTYADLTAAKAWCQAVVTQRHFATLLRQTTEEVADLTRIFNSKHPENPE